jgi:hypothetical protein
VLDDRHPFASLGFLAVGEARRRYTSGEGKMIGRQRAVNSRDRLLARLVRAALFLLEDEPFDGIEEVWAFDKALAEI